MCLRNKLIIVFALGVLPTLADLRSVRAQAYVLLAWGHLWSSGVSGIEHPDPSMCHRRCPCQSAAASYVVAMAWHTFFISR